MSEQAQQNCKSEYQEGEEISAGAVLEDNIGDVLPCLAKARCSGTLLVINTVHLFASAYHVGKDGSEVDKEFHKKKVEENSPTFMMLGCTSFEKVINPLSSLILPEL